MMNEKIVKQLKSELAAAYKATADCSDVYQTPQEWSAHIEGYWEGRIQGLRSALLMLGVTQFETREEHYNSIKFSDGRFHYTNVSYHNDYNKTGENQ